MKKVILASVFLTLISVTSYAQTSITDKLQEVSVTIVNNEGGQGSGVIKTREGVHYIWTAGHVISSGRRTRTVVDATTHSPKTLVYFDDVRVVKDIIENGRLVASIIAYAEVVKFSGPENGEDVALLRLRKNNFVDTSVSFYLENEIIPVGTELLHVGSLLGHFGSNSLTTGIISQQGRLLDGKVFDQTSVTSLPGSSGGGVFLKKDGRYIGMLVRGMHGTDTFNFITPVRRLAAWAKKEHVYWAMDDSLPVDLTSLTIENYEEAPSVSEGGNLEMFRGTTDLIRHSKTKLTLDDLIEPSSSFDEHELDSERGL